MTASKTVWCNTGWLPFHYGFCPSKAAWDRDMRKFKLDLPYPTVDGRCTSLESPRGGLVVLVTIGEHIDKQRCAAAVAGLMAHEAMHVWRFVRERIGETEPSLEFEAYALQAILVDLLAAYARSRPTRARLQRPAT